jgi:thiamine kinase-like enzyme
LGGPGDLERLAVLAGRSWSTEDLPGGLTNVNVRVQSTDDLEPVLDLVVRCSSNDPGLLDIDRDAEHLNTAVAADAGVGAPVVEYREDLRMLVIGFLPGHALVDADFNDPDVLIRAATAVRRLHAGPRFGNGFDMFARQAGYLATIKERGYRLPAAYESYAEDWTQVERALVAVERPSVACNNDLLAANFIDDGQQVWLIDYEYSGNNDACFELGNTANECGFTPELTEAWTAAYFGTPTRADLARVQLQSLCSAYGWSLWGFIQSATSELDFDFWSWGLERFERAAATFEGPAFDRLLSEVSDG